MKVILVALLASYLSAVECTDCASCSAWFDWPVCGHNERCYTEFKSSCDMEVMNCMLPTAYKFTRTLFYGHCARQNINKCKANYLMEELSNKDRSVEIFA